MAKSSSDCLVEDQLKTLQRHFGGIVSTVKDLKSNVEDLKRKLKVLKSIKFKNN